MARRSAELEVPRRASPIAARDLTGAQRGSAALLAEGARSGARSAAPSGALPQRAGRSANWPALRATHLQQGWTDARQKLAPRGAQRDQATWVAEQVQARTQASQVALQPLATDAQQASLDAQQ